MINTKLIDWNYAVDLPTGYRVIVLPPEAGFKTTRKDNAQRPTTANTASSNHRTINSISSMEHAPAWRWTQHVIANF